MLDRGRDRDRGLDLEEVGRRSRRSPSRRKRARRYFDDQVERRSRSRSPSPVRRRRSRSYSDRDEEESDRRSPSPRRGPAPRSCRSRSRTRSEECEDRLCCRRSRSPAGDDDGERSLSPAAEDDFVRIDRPDDLFKCAHCFELLSSPVYEVTR